MSADPFHVMQDFVSRNHAPPRVVSIDRARSLAKRAKPKIPNPHECNGPECERKPHARGACYGHWQQLRRGEPLHPFPLTWSARERTLSAATIRATILPARGNVEAMAQRLGVRAPALSLLLHERQRLERMRRIVGRVWGTIMTIVSIGVGVLDPHPPAP